MPGALFSSFLFWSISLVVTLLWLLVISGNKKMDSSTLFCLIKRYFERLQKFKIVPAHRVHSGSDYGITVFRCGDQVGEIVGVLTKVIENGNFWML